MNVWNIVKKKIIIGSLDNRIRSERLRCASKREDRLIIIQSKRSRKLTAPEITRKLNSQRNKTLFVATVKRCLNEVGLVRRIAVKKSHFRKGNNQKQLLWTKKKKGKNKNWTEKDWKEVLWTDETKSLVPTDTCLLVTEVMKRML